MCGRFPVSTFFAPVFFEPASGYLSICQVPDIRIAQLFFGVCAPPRKKCASLNLCFAFFLTCISQLPWTFSPSLLVGVLVQVSASTKSHLVKHPPAGPDHSNLVIWVVTDASRSESVGSLLENSDCCGCICWGLHQTPPPASHRARNAEIVAARTKELTQTSPWRG